MAYYLGLFGFGPNPSAAIVQDGEVIASAEEERFNRIKTAPNSLPISAISYCLQEAGIRLGEIKRIGFGWDCERYVNEMPIFYDKYHKKYPDKSPQGLISGLNELQQDLLLNLYHPVRVRCSLSQALSLRGLYVDPSRIEFLPHHYCHAASAFYCSGFDRAFILTVDGSGEEGTTYLWSGEGTEIKELNHFELPHTLGGYYATFTEFLGFRAYHDEGKLMGLSSYGRFREDLERKLDAVLSFDPETGDYEVNPYMRYIGKRSHGQRFTNELVDIFGKPRLYHDPITDEHRDLAWAVQSRLERIVAALVRNGLRSTGGTQLCLGGGVAMNCAMNGKLRNLPEVERMFVQPAASDNGIALGAALLLSKEEGHSEFAEMKHVYWGPSYSDEEVEAAIREAKLPYYRSDNLEEEVAELLASGCIIGWFQGRMEIAARALGARSILANPLQLDMRDKINLEVKHREDWRPFCPSMPADDFHRYFDASSDSKFMILALRMREEMAPILPAVVHVDGTARVQTVEREVNPRFYGLLKAFGRRTDHPVLLNTSFNVQGEPIVCTPENALRCFGGTGIDVLVMEDFITRKPSV